MVDIRKLNKYTQETRGRKIWQGYQNLKEEDQIPCQDLTPKKKKVWISYWISYMEDWDEEGLWTSSPVEEEAKRKKENSCNPIGI